VRQIGGVDPRAGVGDLHRRRVAVGEGADADRIAAATVAGRIREEVRHRLM